MTGRQFKETSLSIVVLGLIAISLAGCCADHGDGPTVSVSDAAVFTTLDIRSAQQAYLRDGGSGGGADRVGSLSPFTDLQRYFGSSSAKWPERQLRMDTLLDQTQSVQSLANLAYNAVDLNFKFGEQLELPASNSSAPAAGTSPVDPSDADTAALAASLAASVTDSPFDRLERARSFYTSYVLTLLRLYGTDSRAHRPQELDPLGVLETQSPTPADRKVAIDQAKKAVDDAKHLAVEVEAAGEGELPDDLPKSYEYGDYGKSIRGIVKLAVKQIIGERTKLPELVKAQAAATAGAKSAHELLQKDLAEEKAVTDAIALLAARLAAAETEAAKANIAVQLQEAGTQLEAAGAERKKAQAALAEATKKLTEASGAVQLQTNRVAALQMQLNDRIWSEPLRLAAAIKLDNEEMPRRLVLHMVQSHVEPGVSPDRVARLSFKLTGMRCGAKQINDLSCMNVLFVHPGRTYDLTDNAAIDAATSAISAVIAARIGGPGSVELAATSMKREEARRRYLSRLNKTASFAAADQCGSSFGWYYYPSNVLVDDDGKSAAGYVESGGRDGAVWLLVPNDVDELTFCVTSAQRSIDSGKFEDDARSRRSVAVRLPRYQEAEHGLSAGLAASPMIVPESVGSPVEPGVLPPMGN